MRHLSEGSAYSFTVGVSLADEALAVHDADCAALALQDALWLHVRAGRRPQSVNDGLKLTQLLDSTKLSPEVRKHVRARFR